MQLLRMEDGQTVAFLTITEGEESYLCEKRITLKHIKQATRHTTMTHG